MSYFFVFFGLGTLLKHDHKLQGTSIWYCMCACRIKNAQLLPQPSFSLNNSNLSKQTVPQNMTF